MKTTLTGIAAMFSLLMLVAPMRAGAEVTQFPVQQVGYVQPVGYWHHHRPWACRNRHFRHHHWRMCR